jgi:hypothetical protein
MLSAPSATALTLLGAPGGSGAGTSSSSPHPAIPGAIPMIKMKKIAHKYFTVTSS